MRALYARRMIRERSLFDGIIRGRLPEEGFVISVKGRVVAKATALVDRRGGFSQCDEPLCGKQSLAGEIFFWALLELVFEQTEQVAFGDVDRRGDLSDVADGKQMLVDVLQGGRQEGMDAGDLDLLGFFCRDAAAEEQLAQELWQKRGKVRGG